jgi:hypothetical protein
VPLHSLRIIDASIGRGEPVCSPAMTAMIVRRPRQCVQCPRRGRSLMPLRPPQHIAIHDLRRGQAGAAADAEVRCIGTPAIDRPWRDRWWHLLGPYGDVPRCPRCPRRKSWIPLRPQATPTPSQKGASLPEALNKEGAEPRRCRVPLLPPFLGSAFITARSGSRPCSSRPLRAA